MRKLFLVYFLTFNLSFVPAFNAYALAPAVAIAWGVRLAVPNAIKHLGSTISIQAMARATQAANFYYKATASISSTVYGSYFRKKAAAGITAFSSAVATLGYHLTNDGTLYTSIPESEGEYIEGHVYGSCSLCPKRYYESLGSLLSDYKKYGFAEHVTNIKYKLLSHMGTRWRYEFRGTMNGIDNKLLTTKDFYLRSCSEVTNEQACDSPDLDSLPKPVSPAQLDSSLRTYINGSSTDVIAPIFTPDETGILYKDLRTEGLFEVIEKPPLMPNGSNVPNVGDDLWTYADWIANGSAQSSDSSRPNYVPSDRWDDSYYLANTVAGGDTFITGSNAGAITQPDINNPDTEKPPIGGGTATVNLKGIETRLDTNNILTSTTNTLLETNNTLTLQGNALSQSMVEAIGMMNTTTVETSLIPDANVAASFWPVKYPNGIEGVINEFIEKMKKTPIFQWLNEFVINLGDGSIPVFEVCFNEIANIDFGCYSLSADQKIWLAIKASMILFAVVVSRRIVFGG